MIFSSPNSEKNIFLNIFFQWLNHFFPVSPNKAKKTNIKRERFFFYFFIQSVEFFGSKNIQHCQVCLLSHIMNTGQLGLPKANIIVRLLNKYIPHSKRSVKINHKSNYS